MKKLAEEKKDALAAQFAAEAALRRLHTDQKDDDFLPIDSIIAPLEAEIKMYKNEVMLYLKLESDLHSFTYSSCSLFLF